MTRSAALVARARGLAGAGLTPEAIMLRALADELEIAVAQALRLEEAVHRLTKEDLPPELEM